MVMRHHLVGLALIGMMSMAVLIWPTTPDSSSDTASLRSVYARDVAGWPAPWVDADVAFIELAELRPLAPADPNKVVLGRRLFGDVLLSANGQVACGSCHRPDHGWTIDRPTGEGRQLGARNPPSLHVASRLSHWAWDGRGSTIAAQTLAPLTARDEMANTSLNEVIARLEQRDDYAERFAEIYGEASVTADRLADVLVAFISSFDRATRFDRFMRGERDLLTDREIEGLHVFRTKGRCANCHHGALLTDQRFHNLRISSFGEASADLGRYKVTGQPDDVGRFRTPSLRHVSQTAPYMHSGLFSTLEGVINLYDRGGGEVWARNATEAAHPLYSHAARRSPHIRPLGLSDEDKAALVAFLRTL